MRNDFERLVVRCPSAGRLSAVHRLLQLQVRRLEGVLGCWAHACVTNWASTVEPPFKERPLSFPFPQQPAAVRPGIIVAAVQECLLDPALTLPSITILRRHVLAAISTLVHAVLNSRDTAQPSLELSLALAAVLELAPHADRWGILGPPSLERRGCDVGLAPSCTHIGQ